MTMTLMRAGDADVISSCADGAEQLEQVRDTQTFAVDSHQLRSIRIWHAVKVCIAKWCQRLLRLFAIPACDKIQEIWTH